MERIDVELRIAGHASLDQDIREALRAGEVLKPLSHTLEERVLGSARLGDNSLRALIGECPVFVNVDWVVWIHGPKLKDCFVAMTELVNLIGQELGTPVVINLLDMRVAEPGQLRRRLKREAITGQIGKLALWALGSLVVLIAGGLIGIWIKC